MTQPNQSELEDIRAILDEHHSIVTDELGELLIKALAAYVAERERLALERKYSIETYLDDKNGKVRMKKVIVKAIPPRNIFSIPIDNYRSIKVVIQELTKGEQ